MENRTRFYMRGELIFTTILFIIAVSYMVQAFTLGRSSAQAPIFVMIPLLGLTIFRMFKIIKSYKSTTSEDSEQVATERYEFKRGLFLLCTFVGFVIVLYIVGTYIASGIYLFLFIRYMSRLKLLTALLTSILTPLIIYLSFAIGMEIILFKGILFGG